MRRRAVVYNWLLIYLTCCRTAVATTEKGPLCSVGRSEPGPRGPLHSFWTAFFCHSIQPSDLTLGKPSQNAPRLSQPETAAGRSNGATAAPLPEDAHAGWKVDLYSSNNRRTARRSPTLGPHSFGPLPCCRTVYSTLSACLRRFRSPVRLSALRHILHQRTAQERFPLSRQQVKRTAFIMVHQSLPHSYDSSPYRCHWPHSPSDADNLIRRHSRGQGASPAACHGAEIGHEAVIAGISIYGVFEGFPRFTVSQV